MKRKKIILHFKSITSIVVVFLIASKILLGQSEYETINRYVDSLENSMYSHFSYSMPFIIDSSKAGILLYYDGKNDIITNIISFDEKAIPFLIDKLDTNNSDWIANILLYKITNRSPESLLLFNDLGYELWIKNNKYKDIKYWMSYKL